MLKRLLLLSLFAVSAHAQNGGFTWQDAANGDPVPAGIGGTGGTTNLGASLTVFTDLASFQAAAPMAVNSEDIEDNITGGAISTCTEPVNSASNDACFTPGQFVDGLEITSSGGGGIVILPPGFNGLPSFAMGANTFGDTTFMSFSDGDILAVGMDVFAGLAPSDVILTVSDAGGNTLGTATVAGLGMLPDSGFIGFVSDVPIAQIEIDSAGGNGELFDNVLFGTVNPFPDPPAVPALQTTGLLMLILILAAGSVLLLARRRKIN